MHDVAVPLDHHHIADSHTPILGDSPQVVSCEIDQHDMLGPLLRVGEQLLSQRPIFFFRRAATTRACERPDRHLALFHSHHDLGRTAHQRTMGRSQQEHERRRIHHPQRAVDVDRPCLRLQLKPLAEHHLKDVPGPDVLLAVRHRLLVLLFGLIGTRGERRLARKVDVRQLQVATAPLQAVAEFIHLSARLVVCRPKIARLPQGIGQPRLGDHLDGLVDLVEHQHPVVEPERKVGQLAVIGGRIRQPLDIPHCVVPGVADRPADKPRQPRRVGRLVPRQQPLQFAERVGAVKPMLGQRFRSRVVANNHIAVKRLDLQKGIAADEAEPADLFSANHAFEQERPRTHLQLGIGTNRGERVAHQLTVDRNQIDTLGQSAKRLKIGAIRRHDHSDPLRQGNGFGQSVRSQRVDRNPVPLKI